MSEKTKISWTDSTFNGYWGCTRISPACDNCYAATMAHRFGHDVWDNGKFRILSDENWKKPLRWNRQAEKTGVRRKVFSASMADWFSKETPAELRDRFWEIVRNTPMLDWQILTKRAPNLKKYLPEDWGAGYDNVWLGITVEDKKHGVSRIKDLLNIPAKIKFLSIEPLLEDLGIIPGLDGIDWVIVGGESGHKSRPMKLEWVENIQDQCSKLDVPFFFKQWGGKKKGIGDDSLNGKLYHNFPLSKEEQNSEERIIEVEFSDGVVQGFKDSIGVNIHSHARMAMSLTQIVNDFKQEYGRYPEIGSKDTLESTLGSWLNTVVN